MSRTASTAAAAALNAQSGKDGFVVLKLTLGTQVYWLADRSFTQGGIALDGRVETHGELGTSVKMDSASRMVGTVSTMSFTLLDEDKFFLGLLNSNDFQGATADVYHWFVGHAASDMLLILHGRIESPPEWHEADRTLKLMVETPRRINPIPFSPSEADGLPVDLPLLGHPWPMCFGIPSDVPAVQVKAAPRGTLTQDMTQDGQMVSQTVGGIANVAVDVPTTTFEIDNTNEDFPQGVECLVKVADEYMTGTFSGNTLHVSARQVNHYTGVPVGGNGAIVTVPAGVRAAGQYITIRDLTSSLHSSRPVDEVIGASALAMYSELIGVPDTADQSPGFFSGYCYKQVGTDCYIWNGNSATQLPNAVADINRYPNKASDGARWVHKAGSPVVVASVDPVFIANAIPSTAIVRVRAWRQVTRDDRSGFSQRRLVVVPSSFYTVSLSNAAYNGATTLTFQEALSDREAGWEDEVFVTVQSTVGSNTADAIQYLIDHQSEGKLTSDAASFAAVKALIANYPSNFAIREQGDVLDIAGSIAWQARCGIVMNGTAVQLKYLSKEPTAGVMNFADANTEEGSIKLSSTRIEDIVTVFSVEWRPNYSDIKPQRLLYRNNVSRYGKRERKYEFWIYQARKCVVKSAAFWSARLGRIWRTAEAAQWGLEGLVVDALDYAGWRISEFLTPVYGLVTESGMVHPYTSAEALLPIEAGNNSQSTHFWVSDSGDTAPTTRTYAGDAAAEAEVIQAPPPEVISLTKPEQQVYHVFANKDEVREPASSDWKTVEVRILTAEEVQARTDRSANQEQIDTIDALDPSHHNSTLTTQRQALVSANQDLDAYIQGKVDHPDIVTARNPSPTYMLGPKDIITPGTPAVAYVPPSAGPPAVAEVPAVAAIASTSLHLEGDEGTMIKVPGGEYIVTPAGASGPFIVKILKKPASPAAGTLFADFAGTLKSPVSGTREIQVLGDGSGIKQGDLMLCFRDSLGNYYTPGGGAGGTVGIAKVLTTSGDKNAIPVGIYLTTDTSGDPQITTTAVMPSLASPYKVAAGAFAMASKATDGKWFLQMVTIQNYVP